LAIMGVEVVVSIRRSHRRAFVHHNCRYFGYQISGLQGGSWGRVNVVVGLLLILLLWWIGIGLFAGIPIMLIA